MESINAVLDIFLVVLPVSKVKLLHLPLREKIGLGIVFLMGGLWVLFLCSKLTWLT
jgi:hypothetical protein